MSSSDAPRCEASSATVGEWPSLTVSFSIARLTERLSSCNRRGTLTAQPLSRKYRLISPTIVGEIKRYFRDKGWAVKVPRRLQELNLSVNRAIEKLTVKLGHSPTVAELAAHLGASEEDILEAQELGQAYNLLSLDTELNGEGDKKSQTLADYVGQNDAGLELLEDRANLERAFQVLTGRERVILYLRFYESVSQTEIAKRLNVSQMHVSRLQQKALEKLKNFLQEK